jgi:hypothetical protein
MGVVAAGRLHAVSNMEDAKVMPNEAIRMLRATAFS